MAPGLTEDDLERIEQFVEEPRLRRRPTLLCPDGETGRGSSENPTEDGGSEGPDRDGRS